MLDDTLKTQLKAYLERLQRPVELVATLDNSATSQELRELLEDIRAQSDKITVVEKNDAAVRAPSFLITNPGTDSGVRFAGVPLGHEFTSLVLALLQVGGHPSKEEADLLEQVKGLDGYFHFETYYSLTCHNCPDVVQALNLMAVLNPRIRHVAIDGAQFQDEVAAREVMSVPAVFLNGEVFAYGRMGIDEILAKLDASGGARARALLTLLALLLLCLGLGWALELFRWQLAPWRTQWTEWRSLIQLGLWFTWPAWPLAAWAVWRGRERLSSTRYQLPLVLVLMMLAGALIRQFFVQRHGWRHGRASNPWPFAAAGVVILLGVIAWMRPAPAPAAAAAPAAVAPVAAEASHADHPGAVTSPMVGVAYLSPEPGAAQFVTLGAKVAQGQTLLLIEAMKTFNQIKATRAGTGTRILVEGGMPVEYGEPLFIIE